MRPMRPMRLSGRVVCVGDVMLDISAALPGPLVTGSDTPAPISFRHGGSAANTAAWLAGQGVPCVFAGRVGDDPFGRDAVAALRSHGVTLKVSTDPDTATGICLVLVAPDGERTMVPSAGANATLSAADLGDDMLTAGDHLHLSGYTLLHEGSRPAALFALRLASSVGASVSVDAASAGPIRTVGAQRFLDWLEPGVLLLANTDELAALTGADEVDVGQPALGALMGRQLTVVLKRGGEGCMLATTGVLAYAAAEPAHVRDTTGAGDAFAAGLLAGLWSGAELSEVLGLANRLGAAAVSQLGGRPPRRRRPPRDLSR
jgi:sugar/nucleoside kinase (ribokinase family)